MENYDLIIEPDKKIKHYWKELWSYRELFYFLAWRDIKVQYKQTIIGISWAVIRPFLTMVVFTFVFGKIAKLPSDNIPYPILVFSAMLPWQLFSSSVTMSSNSLIDNSAMISKIYFPRLIIPSSAVIVSFVDFFISLTILFGLMFLYGFYPDIKILLLPFLVFYVMILSFGIGLWFSSLNVKYRDFRYVVPFCVQFGLYVSPVGFSSTIVPEKWKLLYYSNPMVGVIDGFRWIICGNNIKLYPQGVILSFLMTLIIISTGILYFRKTEKYFADVI